MTFLQPLILWALPLLLLPIIIHLVNRLRHRTVHWAAMRFLLRATQSSTSHAKLRQFLILALRVLAVTALIIFIARPLAGGWLGWALAPAPDSIVLLLDRSASMELRAPGQNISRREAALRNFAQAARVFDRSSHLVLIDSATRQPQEISTGSLTNLPQAAATDTAADIPAMLQTALKWLVDTHSGAAEIWIASDMQESNWLPEDGRWKSLLDQFKALPQKIRFRLMGFEAGAEANTSISLAEILRRDRAGQGGLAYVLDLQRTSVSADPIPISIAVGEARSQTEVRSEGTSIRWRSNLALDAARTSGWGVFELPNDANPRDNAAYFVYGERLPLSAAVVSSEPNAARVFSFAASDTGKPAAIVKPEDASGLDLAKLALVVWQAPLPIGIVADRLKTFVEEGGVVIFFAPNLAGAGFFENMSWLDFESATPAPFKIVRWDEDQGPLARTEERLSLPLADVTFAKRQKISGSAQVLASFSDGAPFLERKTIGRGEVYFCASLPLPDWSTLGDGEVLVPMLQRTLQSGAKRLQNALMVNCGELTPALAQLPWKPISSNANLDPKLHAGVYSAGSRLLAVNRPAIEDAPERLDSVQATKLFGDLPTQFWQETASRTDLQGEIWRVFLFAMLLFLLVEGWLILPQTLVGDREEAPARKRMEAVAR